MKIQNKTFSDYIIKKRGREFYNLILGDISKSKKDTIENLLPKLFEEWINDLENDKDN